jgi:hypothetical protein
MQLEDKYEKTQWYKDICDFKKLKVKEGHLVCCVVNVGDEEKHPHSFLMCKIGKESFILESNSDSANVVTRNVYPVHRMCDILGVDKENWLGNSLQSKSNMEICNAYTAIAAYLVMTNWEPENGADFLEQVNETLNSFGASDARGLYLWLLQDYSEPFQTDH